MKKKLNKAEDFAIPVELEALARQTTIRTDNSPQYEVDDRKFIADIARPGTNNSQTLADAEKRIEELEKESESWRQHLIARNKELEDADKEIVEVKSQRDRLLAQLKFVHLTSECMYTTIQTACPTCALIREIEGGR